MDKRRCKSLSLKEKFNIIKLVEKGDKKKKQIAYEHNIPPNTLSTILKSKDKILTAVEECLFSEDRKRLKTSKFPYLEEGLLTWIESMREKNIPISGSLLREKAEQFGKELGYQNFQASSGWLEKFKVRNRIVQKTISGESALVSDIECKKYMTDILTDLLECYNANDIFNAAETGLLFKCLPEKTLHIRGDDCRRGQKSKQRVTVMVAANMIGTEKLKLVVVGKSAKPRCFAGVKSLPVIYEHNEKSWMTSTIYESWLKEIDKQFLREDRKVLLFVNNCPAHQIVLTQPLQAVHVVFLPPNCTSKLQPMNQGIIKKLKFHYRQRIVRNILSKMEETSEICDVNLLDCILHLHKAWEDIKQDTILRCFWLAGFKKPEMEFGDIDVQTSISFIPPEWPLFQKNVLREIETTFDTYVDVDLNLATSETSYTKREIIDKLKMQDNCESVRRMSEHDSADDEDNDNEIIIQNIRPTSIKEALLAISTVRSFILEQSGVEQEVFKAVTLIEDYCEKVNRELKIQTKITNYFKKL